MTDPNVFVLSADSLRHDRSADPEVMPYVSDLAAGAASFRRAASNGGFTPASFPTMMASRYPSSIDGIGIPDDDSVTTLATELDRAGYRCGVWSDNKFVGPDYNYDRGYESERGYSGRLRDAVRERVDEDGLLFSVAEFGYMHVWKSLKNAVTDSHYYDTADVLNGRAREWLDGLDPASDAVHVWVHYMDPHHPYEPPSEWMPTDLEAVGTRTEANNLTREAVRDDGDGLTEPEVRDVVRLYDAECRFLDNELERFVEGYLRPEGWLGEEDVLVVTSDHGEVLHDYRRWDEIGHGNHFCQECTRVPLVVEAPGLDPVDVDEPVSLVDLVPTVLDVLGVDSPARDLLMGESLLPVARGEATREFVFHDGTMGYHGAQGDGKARFAYEAVGPETPVNTTFDPDAPPTYEERVVDGDADHEGLATFVEETLDRCEELARESEAIDPDSIQVEQHMRDLGYLE